MRALRSHSLCGVYVNPCRVWSVLNASAMRCETALKLIQEALQSLARRELQVKARGAAVAPQGQNPLRGVVAGQEVLEASLAQGMWSGVALLKSQEPVLLQLLQGAAIASHGTML